MNMKMEENETGDGTTKKKDKNATGVLSDTESFKSMDEPPKDYEQMLQKYEAEVRNHIKVCFNQILLHELLIHFSFLRYQFYSLYLNWECLSHGAHNEIM